MPCRTLNVRTHLTTSVTVVEPADIKDIFLAPYYGY